MDRRTTSQIKRDLRSCYENAGIGRLMQDAEVEAYFIREARALERELELAITGYVLEAVR